MSPKHFRRTSMMQEAVSLHVSCFPTLLPSLLPWFLIFAYDYDCSITYDWSIMSFVTCESCLVFLNHEDITMILICRVLMLVFISNVNFTTVRACLMLLVFLTFYVLICQATYRSLEQIAYLSRKWSDVNVDADFEINISMIDWFMN